MPERSTRHRTSNHHEGGIGDRIDDDVASHRANIAAADITADGQRATGTVSSVAGNLAESLKNQSKK
jgi:hypothetical protein